MHEDPTQTMLAHLVLDALEDGQHPTLEMQDAAALPLSVWAGAQGRAAAMLHRVELFQTEDDPEPLRRPRALARLAHVRRGGSLGDLPEPPPVLKVV